MLGRVAWLSTLAFVGFCHGACTIKKWEDPGGGTNGVTTSSPSQAGQAGQAGEGSSPEDPDTKPARPSPGKDCSSCAGGICLDDGTCVECLAKDDRCPSGKYCDDDSHRCVSGCNDGSSCASGVCGSDHNCRSCIRDSECKPGYACSSGTCTPLCSAEDEGTSGGCGDGLSCCSRRCADLTTDTRNCGACGSACGAGQFCGVGDGAGGAECRDTTLASVCAVPKIVMIMDSNKNADDGDREPGLAIGTALAEECPTRPALSETMQDSAEALNLTTGRPVSNSSELLVIAGGPFFQDLEGYLEQQQVSPLYWKIGDGFTEYRVRKTDQSVVSIDVSGDHESQDAFIIQFMRDPDSGSLVLNAQGLYLSGTVAAAHQLTRGLLPELSAQDQAWYAYRWTDADGDKAPDTEEIVLVDSGR